LLRGLAGKPLPREGRELIFTPALNSQRWGLKQGFVPGMCYAVFINLKKVLLNIGEWTYKIIVT
jgi:hypothetical protein